MKSEKLSLKKLKDEFTKYSKITKWTILYSSLTLIATTVIAVSTYLNYLSTKGMLNQMTEQTRQIDETIKLESDYYRKTNRPFVFIEKISNSLIVANGDTNVKIEYLMKNVGSLPAKDVRSGTWLRDSIEMITKVDTSKGFIYSSSIFPDQELRTQARIGPIPIRDLNKSPFFIIYIRYTDIGGNIYFFQQLYSIKVTIINGEIKILHPTVKWTEFN